MALTFGTRLGPYEIQSPLGAGGMGEVYRARDMRLGRDVAIKVLPAMFSRDPDRLRRFQQEAQAVAALNHPNILAIHDFGEHQGSPYIVTEFLEGETLRGLLEAGAVPVRKATEWAGQIARGLAAAHDKGIVHRDLKPENIFITRDGRVKILDFGLAKLTPEAVTPDAATLASHTQPGVVLGTVGYMSPEQVRGQTADHRSDLFNLGAILYEMLSGKRAFRGETSVETMSAILKEDPPDLTETGRKIAPALERIVRHCLEKNPEERFQSARDVEFDLESMSTISSSSLPAVKTKTLKTWLAAAGLVAALVLLAAGLLIERLGVHSAGPPQYRQLTFARELMNSARFAPDGRTVIFSALLTGMNGDLFLLTPDSLAPSGLGLKETDIAAISRTGELLVIEQRRQLFAYARVGILARAPLTGAAPRALLSDVQDADWGPDKQIAVAHFAEQRYRLEYPIGHVLYETSGYFSDVHVSPKGDSVAFADHPVLGDNAGTICVVDSAGHRRSLSAPQSAITGLAWAPSGKEIWFSGANVGISQQLKAVDLSGHERLMASAPGSLTIQDIARDGRVLVNHETERAISMALGPDQNGERDLTIVDWTLVNAISPDGRQVLLEEEGSGSQTGYDIYVRATDGSPPVHIGEGRGDDFSPDGKWVLASRGQLFLIPLGPGEPQQITHDSIQHKEAGFLPDGKGVVFTGIESGHKSRIYVQAIGDARPRAISPEGVHGSIPTADGKSVFGFSDEVALYPVDAQGSARVVPGLHADEAIVSVSPDGHSVLVGDAANHISLNIFRVDLASGHRELFKKIAPADPAGVFMFTTGFSRSFTPNGKYYAYAYVRTLGELYIVDGLR